MKFSSRLSEDIFEIEYILNCLKTFKRIIDLGDCNDCRNADCQWKPGLGEQVRYNCPFYAKEEETE